MTEATETLLSPPTPTARRTALRDARVLVLAPTGPETTALVLQLAADDVEVIAAPSAAMARTRLYGKPPTAVLLSAELERSTGYAALEELRATRVVDTDCPAIAFSDKAEPLDRLRAFRRGCLDFLAVPIFYPELAVRVQIAVDRPVAQRSILSAPGGLRLDLKGRSASLGDQIIEFSGMEFALIVKLATEPGRVWTKAELLADVWGMDSSVKTRTLDSHACRLRQKLRDAGAAHHEYVHNIWGVGYRLLSTSAL